MEEYPRYIQGSLSLLVTIIDVIHMNVYYSKKTHIVIKTKYIYKCTWCMYEIQCKKKTVPDTEVFLIISGFQTLLKNVTFILFSTIKELYWNNPECLKNFGKFCINKLSEKNLIETNYTIFFLFFMFI